MIEVYSCQAFKKHSANCYIHYILSISRIERRWIVTYIELNSVLFFLFAPLSADRKPAKVHIHKESERFLTLIYLLLIHFKYSK